MSNQVSDYAFEWYKANPASPHTIEFLAGLSEGVTKVLIKNFPKVPGPARRPIYDGVDSVRHAKMESYKAKKDYVLACCKPVESKGEAYIKTAWTNIEVFRQLYRCWKACMIGLGWPISILPGWPPANYTAAAEEEIVKAAKEIAETTKPATEGEVEGEVPLVPPTAEFPDNSSIGVDDQLHSWVLSAYFLYGPDEFVSVANGLLSTSNFLVSYVEDQNKLYYSWRDERNFAIAEREYIKVHKKHSKTFTNIRKNLQGPVPEWMVDLETLAIQVAEEAAAAKENPPPATATPLAPAQPTSSTPAEGSFLEKSANVAEGKDNEETVVVSDDDVEGDLKALNSSDPDYDSEWEAEKKRTREARRKAAARRLERLKKGKEKATDPPQLVEKVIKTTPEGVTEARWLTTAGKEAKNLEDKLAQIRAELEGGYIPFDPSLRMTFTVDANAMRLLDEPPPHFLNLFQDKIKIRGLPATVDNIRIFIIDNGLNEEIHDDATYAGTCVALGHAGALVTNVTAGLPTLPTAPANSAVTEARIPPWKNAARRMVSAALAYASQGGANGELSWFESHSNVYGRLMIVKRFCDICEGIIASGFLNHYTQKLTIGEVVGANNVSTYRFRRLSTPELVVSAVEKVRNETIYRMIDPTALAKYVRFNNAGVLAHIASGPVKGFCKGNIDVLTTKNIPRDVKIAELKAIDSAPYDSRLIRQAYIIHSLYGTRPQKWYQGEKAKHQMDSRDAIFESLVNAYREAENKTSTRMIRADTRLELKDVLSGSENYMMVMEVLRASKTL